MFRYFLVFTGVGIAIGHLVKDQRQALITVVVIATLWGLASRAIWGFVTLGELLLGYFVYVISLPRKISHQPMGLRATTNNEIDRKKECRKKSMTL